MAVRSIGNNKLESLSYSTLEVLLSSRVESNLPRIIVAVMIPLKKELEGKCNIKNIKLLGLIIEYFGHLIIPTSEYLSCVLFNQLKGVLNEPGNKEFNYILFKALGELMKLCNCYNIIFLQWEKDLKPLLDLCSSKPELAGYSFQLMGILLNGSEEKSEQQNVILHKIIGNNYQDNEIINTNVRT